MRILLLYIVDYEDHDDLKKSNFDGILALIETATLLEELRLEFNEDRIEVISRQISHIIVPDSFAL